MLLLTIGVIGFLLLLFGSLLAFAVLFCLLLLQFVNRVCFVIDRIRVLWKLHTTHTTLVCSSDKAGADNAGTIAQWSVLTSFAVRFSDSTLDSFVSFSASVTCLSASCCDISKTTQSEKRAKRDVLDFTNEMADNNETRDGAEWSEWAGGQRLLGRAQAKHCSALPVISRSATPCQCGRNYYIGEVCWVVGWVGWCVCVTTRLCVSWDELRLVKGCVSSLCWHLWCNQL